MRPLALKGHERPIRFVKYNREGDVFVSCALDKEPTLWRTDTGERIGTYKGHNGAVWCCDIDSQTRRMVTAGADNTCKIWDVQSGKELFSIQHAVPCRSCEISSGDEFFHNCMYPRHGLKPVINVYKFAADSSQQDSAPVQRIEAHDDVITHAMWNASNTEIVSCSQDTTICKWDVETGTKLATATGHSKAVNMIQFNADRTHFVSASKDSTAKLWDYKTMKCIKTYKTEAPVNCAAISPLHDHVLTGGGQDAADVTTTAGASGKFEVHLFHKVLEEELDLIKGHFSPVNFVAIAPDGRSFVTGAEEGYCRLHHFDKTYVDWVDED